MSADAEAPRPAAEKTPLDRIMDEHNLWQRCVHGTKIHLPCSECEEPGPETDPWFVLSFCKGAITDAIGLEDGLDGSKGNVVLAMIRNAEAARRAVPSGDAPTPNTLREAYAEGATDARDFSKKEGDDIDNATIAKLADSFVETYHLTHAPAPQSPAVQPEEVKRRIAEIEANVADKEQRGVNYATVPIGRLRFLLDQLAARTPEGE